MEIKMKEIIVEHKPVSVNPGHKVGLTPEQADSRAHNLKKTDKDGVFEVVRSIQFKVGEVFSTDQPEKKSDKPKTAQRKVNKKK